MANDPSSATCCPQERSTCGLDSGLCDRAARLEALSQKIKAGQYHVPAAAIAERILERLATRRRDRAG